jgi:hypothetical protein
MPANMPPSLHYQRSDVYTNPQSYPMIKTEDQNGRPIEGSESLNEVSNNLQKQARPEVKRRNGKKKPIMKKHKPAANSKVVLEKALNIEKSDLKPKTEIWEWKKIQEMASRDDKLSSNIESGECGKFIAVS